MTTQEVQLERAKATTAASAATQNERAPSNQPSAAQVLEGDIFDRLHELYQEEQQAAAWEGGATDGDDAASVASDEEGEEELVSGASAYLHVTLGTYHVLDRSSPLHCLRTTCTEQLKKKCDKPSSTAAWPWRDRLLEIFKKIAGLEKLSRLKPLTAPIGNWGILDAVRRLNDYPQLPSNIQLSAALFMGRGRKRTTRMPVVLTKYVSSCGHSSR
jgi:hypothetical protein